MKAHIKSREYQEKKILLLRDLKKLVKYINSDNMETIEIDKIHSIIDSKIITDVYYNYIWE